MIAVGVPLAVLASVGYGVSDVLSGTVVRRHPVAALALWAQVTGLVVLGGATLVVRPQVAVPGLAWGAGAGAVAALAVLAFYAALQRGRTSVVAPVAGAGVVVPVAVGLASGERVGPLAVVGALAAVAGILLVAAAPGEDDGPPAGTPRRSLPPVPGRAAPVPVHDGCLPARGPGSARSAVWSAAVAAAGFGAFFVLLERATDRAATSGPGGSGALAVALAVQVGALAVTLPAATRHTRACLAPGRDLAVPAVAVGLLDVGADLLLTLAVDRGPLTVVGPLASLDPVVAVLLATLVLRERLRVLPAVGVLVALAGLVLVAAG